MLDNPCGAGGPADAAAKRLLEWVRDKRNSAKGKHVVYSAVFCVLEAIRERGWPLRQEDYISPLGQIRISGSKFKKVLEKALGAERASRLSLPSEGGRTTRSAPRLAQDLVKRLSDVLRDTPSPGGWESLADCLELVVAEEYERDMRAVSPIRVRRPNAQHPLSEFVRQALNQAGTERRGAVAHHLVGAKLALRFGEGEGLAPRSYRAADQQAEAPGDYWHGDTVFHVTVSPTRELFRKCASNLDAGRRVWVITLRENIDAAVRQANDVKQGLAERVQIISISDFVGQNLEELGDFSASGVDREAQLLVEEYNRRIDKAENGDASLKIQFG